MNEAALKHLESMPRKIKVGAYDFTVDIADVPYLVDGEDSFGSCNTAELRITIAVGPNTTRLQLTGVLVHELHHAMWEQANLKKRAAEEDVVLAFEHGWIMLFRNNPKLITWIKKGLK